MRSKCFYDSPHQLHTHTYTCTHTHKEEKKEGEMEGGKRRKHPWGKLMKDYFSVEDTYPYVLVLSVTPLEPTHMTIGNVIPLYTSLLWYHHSGIWLFQLIFSEDLLYARHCAKYFTKIISFNPYNHPWLLLSSPFTNEKTGS